MGEHLVDGEFQSDKYPTCPRGKVPLSCTDPMAQDLLYIYAVRRSAVDQSFSNDLMEALRLAGYRALELPAAAVPAEIPVALAPIGVYQDLWFGDDETKRWVAIADHENTERENQIANKALGTATERDQFWEDGGPWWAATGATPEAAIAALIEKSKQPTP